MTADEAAALKVGDTIEVWTGRYWKQATVLAITDRDPNFDLVRLRYRRTGATRNGRKYASQEVWLAHDDPNLRFLPVHDPQTGNVFSDYLEEAGFAEAAAYLRRAFPLADGKPVEEKG